MSENISTPESLLHSAGDVLRSLNQAGSLTISQAIVLLMGDREVGFWERRIDNAKQSDAIRQSHTNFLLGLLHENRDKWVEKFPKHCNTDERLIERVETLLKSFVGRHIGDITPLETTCRFFDELGWNEETKKQQLLAAYAFIQKGEIIPFDYILPAIFSPDDSGEICSTESAKVAKEVRIRWNLLFFFGYVYSLSGELWQSHCNRYSSGHSPVDVIRGRVEVILDVFDDIVNTHSISLKKMSSTIPFLESLGWIQTSEEKEITATTLGLWLLELYRRIRSGENIGQFQLGNMEKVVE